MLSPSRATAVRRSRLPLETIREKGGSALASVTARPPDRLVMPPGSNTIPLQIRHDRICEPYACDRRASRRRAGYDPGRVPARAHWSLRSDRTSGRDGIGGHQLRGARAVPRRSPPSRRLTSTRRLPRPRLARRQTHLRLTRRRQGSMRAGKGRWRRPSLHVHERPGLDADASGPGIFAEVVSISSTRSAGVSDSAYFIKSIELRPTFDLFLGARRGSHFFGRVSSGEALIMLWLCRSHRVTTVPDSDTGRSERRVRGFGSVGGVLSSLKLLGGDG